MNYAPGTEVRENEGYNVQEPAESYITAINQVLIKSDLEAFLLKHYKAENITEVNSNIRDLEKLPATDLEYSQIDSILIKVH